MWNESAKETESGSSDVRCEKLSCFHLSCFTRIFAVPPSFELARSGSIRWLPSLYLWHLQDPRTGSGWFCWVSGWSGEKSSEVFIFPWEGANYKNARENAIKISVFFSMKQRHDVTWKWKDIGFAVLVSSSSGNDLWSVVEMPRVEQVDFAMLSTAAAYIQHPQMFAALCLKPPSFLG